MKSVTQIIREFNDTYYKIWPTIGAKNGGTIALCKENYRGRDFEINHSIDYLEIGDNWFSVNKKHLEGIAIDDVPFDQILMTNNIEYIDFLTINANFRYVETILNSNCIILPKYMLIKNNDCDLNTLHNYGYVCISKTESDTFLYNCKNHFEQFMHISNIVLKREKILNKKKISHFFQDVHSYMTYGQVSLFKDKLKLIVNEHTPANIIWTTQSIDHHMSYKKICPDATLINVVHGDSPYSIEKLLDTVNKPNIIFKSIKDIHNAKDRSHCTFFLGKYESISDLFESIYEHRKTNIFTKQFLNLSGFTHESIRALSLRLRELYGYNNYGYDSDLGWADTMSRDLPNNVLTQYKFFLHLKGQGYLCNSPIFAMMCGIPVIMEKKIYYNTLYCQFIPKDLIIFYENIESIENTIKNVLKMPDNEYLELSKKLFIHGTYFRTYYADEIERLYYFINHLQ